MSTLRRCLVVLLLMGFATTGMMAIVHGAAHVPELAGSVNDFADVIDPETERQIDQLSRSLEVATGDVIVVATIPTVEPFGDIREYALELFENRGRGIGQKGKDNGLLILLAVKQRRVWIEVGYGLEQWITDGYAGETSRDYMVPEFRNGRFGAGLLNGAARIAGRIAQGRHVTLRDIDVPREQRPPVTQVPFSVILLIFIAFLLFSGRRGGPRRGVRSWGRGHWSGWSSGVGPFGGGGGAGRSGGFGGGFGGFRGGRSGGGGGGAGW